MAQPYLSIVATTRNDNHGGDLNHRTQVFIDSMSALMSKHRIPSELIIVEWNPPKDRPSMEEAFKWPKNNPYLQVRIVTVPNTLHQNFKYSDKLPLFQMIAKNAGLRRAKGEFILETNIDIVLSDELCDFIGKRKLQKNVMYRCDRVDVDRHVPLNVSIEETLKYCTQNVLRVNKKDGIYGVPAGSRQKIYEAATAQLIENDLVRTDETIAGKKLAYIKSLVRNATFKSMNVSDHNQIPHPLRVSAKMSLATSGVVAKTIYRSIRNTSVARWAERAYLDWNIRKSLGYKPTVETVIDDLFSEFFAPPRLHTNACGDFLLMDQESWLEIKGSPELETYSMHIDSLTMMAAYASGKHFEILSYPMVHYHIEHGNGWTPEGSRGLYRSFNTKGIGILSHGDYLKFAHKLLHKFPDAQNKNDWGLDSFQLKESVLTTQKSKDVKWDSSKTTTI